MHTTDAQPVAAPDPRTEMTLTELADFQAIAAHHITFSLTLACPLRCAHCIVSAAPELGHTTMPVAVAERYAAQMPELAARGIRSLSFTGGEPLLARRQLRLLSQAAAEAGIACGIVTAGHWAKTRALADRTVADFPAIANWDVSLDRFHLDWVAFETVLNAVEAARDAGRRVGLRFSYEDPPTEQDLEILAAIRQIPGVKLAAQRVRKEGRGREMALAESRKYSPWVKPCLTQGLVVRYDGSLAPCCVNLVEARSHPFQFGDARTRPLAEIHDDYLAQPLLQLIRTLGFAEPWAWLEEAGFLDRELPAEPPDDACDLCSLVMQQPQAAAFLNERAARPEVEARIALLASRILGEHGMAVRLAERWRRDPATRPEGLEGFEDYVAAVTGEVQP